MPRAPGARPMASRPFVLFVSSLWRYKNCDGLLRAWTLARHELGERQLVIVGPEGTRSTGPVARACGRARHLRGRRLRRWSPERRDRPLLPGRRPTRVSVFQRDLRVADPRGDGVCAVRSSPRTPARCPRSRAEPRSCPTPRSRASIARAIVEAAEPGRDRLRDRGLRRAGQFTWGATAASTVDVYREAAERRRGRQTMKILVTGGAGFIGSHTCDRLWRSDMKSWCSMR